jgi:cytidyltransferase-like protein
VVTKKKDNYKTVAVSGGFDPIHIGHVRMFKQAAKLGKLVVIVNNDKFLLKKKGYIFMPLAHRMELIDSIGCVDKVIPAIDKDSTVCETLRNLKPDIFANGGDRKKGTVREEKLCQELGIKMVYGIGGGKIESSSELVKKLNT